MKLHITLEIDLGNHFFDPDESDELEWFERDIVGDPSQLYIHSNEIGDELGEVTKIINYKLIKDTPKKKGTE